MSSNLVDKLTLKTENKTLNTIAEMRWLSDSVGIVYDQQVDQLKKLAALVFEDGVAVISISKDDRTVTVETPTSADEITEKFPEMVQFILGDSWAVKMCYNVKHGPVKTGRKGNSTKRKGKKRTRAIRRK